MYKETKLHNTSEQYIIIQDGEVHSHIELWVCDKETQQPPLYLTKDEALQLSNELKIFAENYTGYER